MQLHHYKGGALPIPSGAGKAGEPGVAAFDGLADTYDSTFTDTGVGRALREIVWARLEHTFSAGQRVLELGCGTGEDALRLAARGVRAVAIDISPRMIRAAQDKARSNPHAARVEFQCGAMEDLGPGLGQFDGVLSNFGVVNCARNLPSLVANVAAHVVRGGRLIWVVMGRHVPWEWAWFLCRGSCRKAWRRLKPGGVQWRGLTVSYPTPAELSALLQPFFRVDRVAPLGFALPPSYAAHWLNRSPRLLAAFAHVEQLAQRSSVLASWSDHYIIEATRLPSAEVP